MAHHPFDQKIRESMESKTIDPKHASWDRLQAMISHAEEQPAKKSGKSLWYLLAAAVLVIGFFMNQWPADNNVQHIQENPISTPKVTYSTSKSEETKQVEPNERIEVKQKMAHQVQPLVENIKPRKMQSNKSFPTPLTPKPETVLPVDTRIANQISTDHSNSTMIEKVSTTETYVSLLPEPQMKLKRFTVDPNSLLENTQNEIQKDYREGVFKRINNQYKTVKEAFVNRNEQ
ncbi:MAG: hypothetical protein CFE24_11800 [Flavobacterium sp. BFFFF2]|nr:MAG: hypothetical protein CFE24_11800 [Flavobacterium sp. BFFFF2]